MNDTGPTCEACVRRWEMGDAQGTIDPHLAPWHDPHHALLAAKDAEIARLRDVIRHGLDAHIEGSVIRMWIFAREAKAALVRLEG